jgi:hypothetical protein
VGYAFYGLLSHLPPGVGLVLLAALPTAGIVWLHHFVTRHVNPEDLIEHREIAGFLVSVVGVVFAVSLGFTVVTVWLQFNNAQQTADTEASDLGEVAAVASMFREPARSRLRTLIADYAFEVRDREWRMMADGSEDPQARAMLLNAIGAVASLSSPANPLAPVASSQWWLQKDALDILQRVSVERRERIVQAGARLQGELYLALTINALIVIGFVFLFGVRNHALQLVMTGCVAGAMSVQLAVIVELDRPYSGDVRVSSAAWSMVIDNNQFERYRSR